MKLWETDHPYYCEEGNYRGGSDTHFSYNSWEEFLVEWEDVDMDYNLLFRWDWLQEFTDEHEVRLFWMIQRKGDYRSCTVKVTKADEPAIREYIAERWEHLKKLWEGVS